MLAIGIGIGIPLEDFGISLTESLSSVRQIFNGVIIMSLDAFTLNI